MHGGLSTGPRTVEGRARVAAATRAANVVRWSTSRAKRGSRNPMLRAGARAPWGCLYSAPARPTLARVEGRD